MLRTKRRAETCKMWDWPAGRFHILMVSAHKWWAETCKMWDWPEGQFHILMVSALEPLLAIFAGCHVATKVSVQCRSFSVCWCLRVYAWSCCLGWCRGFFPFVTAVWSTCVGRHSSRCLRVLCSREQTCETVCANWDRKIPMCAHSCAGFACSSFSHFA